MNYSVQKKTQYPHNLEGDPVTKYQIILEGVADQFPRIIGSSEDQGEALALVWALNNPADLLKALKGASTYMTVNSDMMTRFPSDLKTLVWGPPRNRLGEIIT